jgi:hypothetical protein
VCVMLNFVYCCLFVCLCLLSELEFMFCCLDFPIVLLGMYFFAYFSGVVISVFLVLNFAFVVSLF